MAHFYFVSRMLNLWPLYIMSLRVNNNGVWVKGASRGYSGCGDDMASGTLSVAGQPGVTYPPKPNGNRVVNLLTPCRKDTKLYLNLKSPEGSR
jgi:hypothetical protein